jgi:hypothetical protein
MASRLTFHVAPRYSGGSPAMVDATIAEHVAKTERDEYNRRLSGAFGPEERLRATRLGLNMIVYTIMEIKSTVYVRDEITGDSFAVPLKMWPEVRDRKLSPEFQKYKEVPV